MDTASTTHAEPNIPKVRSRYLDYMSLVIALVIVFGVTWAIAVFGRYDHAGSKGYLMNIFMGVFLIVFAIPKLFNLGGFVKTFKQYDILSRRFPIYARALPFVELTLGVILLVGVLDGASVADHIVNGLIGGIAALTLVGVTQAIRQKKQLNCACLGSRLIMPLSGVAIIENGLMVLMALYMITTGHGDHAMQSIAHYRMMG